MRIIYKFILLCGFLVNLQAKSQKEMLSLILDTVSKSDNSQVQINLIKGIIIELSGQKVDPPENWQTLYDKLKASDNQELKVAALNLSRLFGGDDPSKELIKIVLNKEKSSKSRIEALKTLVSIKSPTLKIHLSGIVKDKDLSTEAIKALIVIQDNKVVDQLIKNYKQLSYPNRRELINTLVARKDYGSKLILALRKEIIPKSDISVHLARVMLSTHGQRFIRVYGGIKQQSKDKSKEIEQHKTYLTDKFINSGNVVNGRKIFNKSCMACHKLYKLGGDIGPDLTGSNRANLNYILHHIVDPNADVPESYRMQTINTHDGRIIVGRISLEDPQKIQLITTGQKETIFKKDIKSRKESPVSMMPEGLLNPLSKEERRDLILYLRSTKQVSLEKEK